MTPEIYRLSNITREFSVGQERIQAIRDVNLTVRSGEFVAIRGRSGAGKSTLLGVLGLMDRPTGGVFEFVGQTVTGLPSREIDSLRRRSIGFLFQQDFLIQHFTIYENLALPLRYNNATNGLSKKIEEALSRVGLTGKANRVPRQLSGGERTRAALARAIITKPQVLLADEPTGALDTETASTIMGLLTSLHQEGITVVVVTHDADVAKIATREVIIRDGRAYD